MKGCMAQRGFLSILSGMVITDQIKGLSANSSTLSLSSSDRPYSSGRSSSSRSSSNCTSSHDFPSSFAGAAGLREWGEERKV